jgi:hypothetical protein
MAATERVEANPIINTTQAASASVVTITGKTIRLIFMILSSSGKFDQKTSTV